MTCWCPVCQEDVDVLEEDEGIGSYEFWGQKCVDTRIVYRCANCGEELDYDPTPDPPEDYDDHDLNP